MASPQGKMRAVQYSKFGGGASDLEVGHVGGFEHVNAVSITLALQFSDFCNEVHKRVFLSINQVKFRVEFRAMVPHFAILIENFSFDGNALHSHRSWTIIWCLCVIAVVSVTLAVLWALKWDPQIA